MSRYIEQDYIGSAVSQLPTKILQTEHGTELVVPVTDVIEIIKTASSLDICFCRECKKLRDCRHDSWQKGVIDMGYIGWCKKTSRLGAVTYVKDSDFCKYGERKSDE